MYIISHKKTGRIVASYDESTCTLLTPDRNSPLKTESNQVYLLFALQCFSKNKSFSRKDFSLQWNNVSGNGVTNIKSEVKSFLLENGVDIFVYKKRNTALNPDYTVEYTQQKHPAAFSVMPDCYPQTIQEPAGGASGRKVCRNTEAQTAIRNIIEKKKQVLVLGEGGIGKTFFLKTLYLALMPGKQETHLISLSMLLHTSLSKPLPEPRLADDIAKDGGFDPFAHTYNSYIMQYIRQDSACGIKKGAFFLLDGLNELLDQRRPGTFGIIDRLIAEIASLCQAEYVHVVITSRSGKDSEFLDSIPFRKWTLSPIEQAIPETAFPEDSSPEDKAIISEWLRRPLFYRMYAEMNDRQETLSADRYRFMEKFYLFFYRKTVENKQFADTTAHMMLYFFLMPLIACETEARRAQFLTLKEFRNLLIRKLPGTQHEKSAVTAFLNSILSRSSVKSQPISGISDMQADAYLEMVRNIDIVQIEPHPLDSSVQIIRFSHQEWREWLSAFYILNYLAVPEQMTDCPQWMPSFNLVSSIQQMIMSELELVSVDDNTPKETADVSRRRFTELFSAVSQPMPDASLPGYRNEQTQEYITDMTDMLYAAFELHDHFRLHITRTFGALAEPYVTFLMRISEKNNISGYLNRDRTVCLFKILSGMLQYYRLKKKFDLCRVLYTFASDKLKLHDFEHAGGKEFIAFQLVRHEYAKAMLFEGCMLLSGGDTDSGRTLCRNAIALLEQNKSCNMSANLLGCMYATPIRPLTEHGLITRSMTKAFEVYYGSYCDMVGKTGRLYVLNGTELLYTVRQMLGLLLKGHLLLEDGENCTPKENSGNTVPDAVTLRLAEEVLNTVKGHDMAFLNWLRAMYYAYTEPAKKQKEILQLFETEHDNYMTIIARLSQLASAKYGKPDSNTHRLSKPTAAANNELHEKVETFLKQIGIAANPDQTDKYYLLEDAVRLIEVLTKRSETHPGMRTKEIQKLQDSILKHPAYCDFRNKLP